MPTYSYRCTECENAFDIQQAFTDDSLTECPACHGKLRKVFSAIGVSFTGSGFYRNDSRADQTSAARKSESTGSGKSDAGSGSGSGKSDAGSGSGSGKSDAGSGSSGSGSSGSGSTGSGSSGSGTGSSGSNSSSSSAKPTASVTK